MMKTVLYQVEWKNSFGEWGKCGPAFHALKNARQSKKNCVSQYPHRIVKITTERVVVR